MLRIGGGDALAAAGAVIDDGNQMEDGAQAEGGERYAKDAVAAADQGQNSVK
jgi:hypothetical protein